MNIEEQQRLEHEKTLEKSALLIQQHQQWLGNAITHSVRALLDQHEENIINTLANRSLDKETSTETVRLWTAQLKTTKAIKKLIYDTETFVTKSLTA